MERVAPLGLQVSGDVSGKLSRGRASIHMEDDADAFERRIQATALLRQSAGVREYDEIMQ